MKKISWDFKSYYINGEPVFLVSGEFHYFRVPKKDWERRLKLLKEAGGNCVATYIPWLIHEPVEGDIRFGDVPERDLEGFLQLCREMDLFVIARPGPYQYSELRYDGLPGWLCENYPEIRARDVHGRAFRVSSISYLHPLFLEKAKKWYDAVCPILAKYTLSRGGPVAFVQFDNELMGIHQWHGGWDYNPEAMGIGKAGGRYVEFLRNRYETIEALNKAYGTEYGDFTDVRPFAGSPATPEDKRRAKDYQDFYFGTIGEYARILTDWMRQAGIDCDVVHNSPNPDSNAQFLEVRDKLGEGFMLGSDHYYTLGLSWPQNNPTPQYASRIFYSNEMLRLMGYPATIFELPGGSLSEWPPILPEDLACCYMTNVAFGMKGLNYYIFTGGPNPFGQGSTGDIYDYGASIGADGSIRPTYDVQKNFGAFLKENAWLARADRVADFYIGLDWEQSRSYSYFGNSGGFEFTNTQAWEFMRLGMMITALCAQYSVNLADLSKDSLLALDKPLLIATSVCMAEDIQRRLVQFVQKGGKLLLCPVIPYMDENFNPCTILRDFLEGAAVEPCTRYAPVVNVGNIHNIFMNGSIFRSVKKPAGARVFAWEERSGAELGWEKSFDGGKVLWLGFRWNHAMEDHIRMLRYLLSLMGCQESVVQSDNHNLWTSLRTDGSRYMLFVMNLYSSPQKANIRVRLEDGSCREIGEVRLAPMEVKTFKW